jgi:hypothetical protein
MLRITNFVLAVAAAAHMGEGQAPAMEPAPASMFVARVTNVPTSQRDAFVACVGRSDLRRWQKLERKGLLQAGRVFETRKVLRQNPADQPVWNFLFVAQVRDEGVARRFAPLRRTACERAAGAQLRRVELLTGTPHSVHPAPRAPRPDIIYIAEYIAVDDTQEALSTYRDLMRTAQGPAVGEVIKAGQLDSLVAMETARVLYQDRSMPRWNQLHVRGTYPEIGIRTLGTSTFIPRFNPKFADRDAVFRVFDGIRHHTREDEAGEVAELRVGQWRRPVSD